MHPKFRWENHRYNSGMSVSRVAIVRAVPEMFGDIDQHFSVRGMACESVSPDDFIAADYFTRESPPEILVIPTTVFESVPHPDWVKVVEEAAASVGSRLVWMSPPGEKSALPTGQTVLTDDELPGFVQQVMGEESIQEVDLPPPETVTAPSGTLLNKLKSWVQADEPAPSRLVATESNDVQVLREYIRVRDVELTDVRSQLTLFEVENQKLLKDLEFVRNEKNALEHKLDTIRGRLLFLEEENEKVRKQKVHELDALRAEFKNKVERLTIAEQKLHEQELKFDDLRSRVRNDLFSVQERERYLDARIEILKRDTEILLHQKDERIIELQENVKQLEFKNDALQDQVQRVQERDRDEQDRSQRVVRALKLATSLLDQDEELTRDGNIRKRET